MAVVLFNPAISQDAASGSKQREFVQISSQESSPSVSAIAPIDDKNVFFLNKEGQIGVAKFSPGLSQIGWELYSDVKWSGLSELTIGPNYSLVFAAPGEITQAFDTDQNMELDFFQALVRTWPGKDQGSSVTAGPIADAYGRILFAISPYIEEEGETPRARIVAWHPSSKELIPVTNSQLPVSSFALSSDGLLAARLDMPDYKDGYYLSLTEIPSFNPQAPVPESVPYTRPSLLIPAELTKGAEPTKFAFYHDGGQEKLLATCPDSRRLIEIIPEERGGIWQGSFLVHSETKEDLVTLVEMKEGSVLGGGESGFIPVELAPDDFRISKIELRQNLIVLDFTQPVDRTEAVKPESYSVTAISLSSSGDRKLAADPIIESDGETVILKVEEIPAETVLRIVCQNVPSDSGESLLSPMVFSTIHKK